MLSIFMPLLWEAGWQLFLVWALWLAWQSIVITRETGLEIDGDGDGDGDGGWVLGSTDIMK